MNNPMAFELEAIQELTKGQRYYNTALLDYAIGELCRCRYHSGCPLQDVNQASRSKRQPGTHDGV